MDATGFRVRKFSIIAGGSATPVRATGGGGVDSKGKGGGKKGAGASSGQDIYAPGDFGVGEEVWIHGRRFRIVDADLTTRQWFQRNLGRSLGPAEDYPDDGYGAERAKVSIPKKRSMMPAREKGEFYKKDRKVLRFFCKYKDSRLQGDKRDYILYYYLLNDTIEIKEVAAEGRHNFPNLLRRQKLPKDSMFVPTGYGGVISPRDPQRERVSSVTWEDLQCGEAINVYGRHLLLMACDSSTKEWYARRGIKQRTLTVSQGEVEDHTEVLTPAYNGYGNEDDLYAMGLSLEPLTKEVNQEEYERFLKGDKKVLRFQAKLRNVTNNDKTRDFVINYFLADDTLSVFEPPVRNSGVVGGLFLARGKYKKYIPAVGQQKEGTRLSEKITMDGGLLEAAIGLGGQLSRWLKPTDFLPGTVVTFEMPSSGSKLFTLEILGHDEYTRKLLEDKARELAYNEIFPQGSAHLAVTRLAEVFSSAKLPVRSVFRANDPSMKGAIGEAKFRRTLRQIENEAIQAPSAKAGATPLSEEELSEVVLEFSDGGTGKPGTRGENKVLYDDFVDMLVVASPSTAKLKDRGAKASMKVEDRILKVMYLHYEENPKASRLRAAFRQHDKDRRGTVKQSQWVVVLRETKLSSVMTRQVAEAICLEHDTRADGTLDYAALCDDIFPGDFDHFAHQQHFVYKDPAKDSDEEDLHDNSNDEDAEWATASACGGDGDDERPECDDSLKGSSGSRSGSRSGYSGSLSRSGSAASVGGLSGDRRPGERCATADAAGGERGRSGSGRQRRARSPPKRRMSMSMVLPEGPVRRHRYQPPPTVHSYLNKMNEAEFDFHGDTNKQLARAMKAFSSSFARANRRKLLRKHFLAFDVNNTHRISRAQFVDTVNEVASEFFIDFDKRNKELLAAFFFPKEHGRVEYETLLEIITARDVRRAHAFRQQTLEEGADFDELFTGIDNTARKRDFGGTLNLFATAY
eukprot:g9432.t1